MKQNKIMTDRECLNKIAPFLNRLCEPRYDKFETNDYICNSSNCKDALEAYQHWCNEEYKKINKRD